VRRALRFLFAALDLATIAGQLDGISPGSVRAGVLVLVAVLGAVIVVLAVILALALVEQRRPPYPMT
jgi:hypothetical protein